MELARKPIYCAGEHLTDYPLPMEYASVLRCESVILAFLIDFLNDYDIIDGDIQNA